MNQDPHRPPGNIPPVPPRVKQAPPNLIGQRIGNYQVVRAIGQGGMGAVYEAVHGQLGRRVAIKVLLPHYAQNEDMVVRFFNEARAVNIVQHPGIVNIFELGQLDDGTVYIIMEFLDGQTLGQRIEALSRRPVRETLRLFRQVASALAAAHKKGIVHRDLKPDNVMIIADPDMPGGVRTKLLDFGVAKIAEEFLAPATGKAQVHTRTGLVIGTPRYMSPEQCRGVGGIGDRADVYALGAMLYHVFGGRPPFTEEAMGDLLVAQIHHRPRPLRELAPQVPAPVAELVHALLAKQPGSRPAMAQVAEELERLEADPDAVRPASLRPPPVPGARPQEDADLAVSPSMFMPELPPGMALGSSPSPAPPSAAVREPSGPRAPVAREPSGPRDPAARESSGPRAPVRSPPEDSLSGWARASGDARPAVPGEGSGAFAEPSLADEDLRPPRSPWGRRLAALLVLGLVGGAVAGYPALRRSLYRPSPATGREGDAAVLLINAERALLDQRWGEARAKAEKVLAMPGVSPEAQDLARAHRERSRREEQAQATYERFRSAVARRALDEAVESYRALPADSVYRGLARGSYEQIFTPFAAAHMARAKAARRAGRCADYQAHLEQVLGAEPRYAPGLRLRDRGCSSGPGPDDDGGDEVAAPLPAFKLPPAPAVPLPRPPAPALDDEQSRRLLHDAQVQYQAGSYEKAMDTLRPLADRPASWREAWVLIGMAACKQGDTEQVMRAYQRLQADPGRRDTVLATCGRVGIRLSDGRFVEDE